MGIENSQGHGSMFGVVDSLNNLASAMTELLQFLPEDFVWPTILNASPFSAYAEWGRDSTTENLRGVVWLSVSSEGVKMNADFRPNWPECGASDFDAKIAAEWLLELTKDWEWEATNSNGHISSSLRNPSRNG